jgi:hypothetical protein
MFILRNRQFMNILHNIKQTTDIYNYITPGNKGLLMKLHPELFVCLLQVPHKYKQKYYK